MLRLYRFPRSLNVERVALALAHKGLSAEPVVIDPSDRSEVRRVSGQELVPVLASGERVLSGSMAIVRHLEQRFPEPALWPAEPSRRAEVDLFIDWFDEVWKRPPNDIEAEMGRPGAEIGRIAEWGALMRTRLDLFEDLLDGRSHLMGAFSAADACAFPFLKYATLELDPEDGVLFHRILREHLATERHPRVAAWIARMDALPRG